MDAATATKANARLISLALEINAMNISEIPHNSNHGAWVENFQRTVSGGKRNGKGSADAQSYCMDGLQYLIMKVEQEMGIVSRVPASQGALDVWNRCPADLKHTAAEATPAMLAIWQHGTSSNGHCGIVVQLSPLVGHFETVEWNTGPSDATVEREGDGVYEKRRPFAAVGDMHLKGFVKVFG